MRKSMVGTYVRRLILAGAMAVGIVSYNGGGAVSAEPTHRVNLYDGGELGYLVKINAPGRCSGAMIRENQIITAAHCIIDRRTGKPSTDISVEVAGKTFRPAFVIYDRSFVEPYVKDKKGIGVARDVAILSFTSKLGGRVVATGQDLPAGGQLIALGYQSTWPETGELLRPKFYDDKSYLKPGINRFESKPAACQIPVGEVEVRPEGLSANCGLIPGASGGPLLLVSGDGAKLVGILSTVNQTLTRNNWAGSVDISRIENRVAGVVVHSQNGPIAGAPPYRS